MPETGEKRINMDKREVRKQVTDLKNALTKEQVASWSKTLKERFCALDAYKQAQCIYFYMTYNNEVQTSAMIEQAIADGKRAAVPITLASGETKSADGKPKRDYMEFVYLKSLSECSAGYMGIPEPEESLIKAEPERIANEKEVLILMPGLAFDRSMNRIGYGGGFYDKYLSSHADTAFTKIALGFDFQLFETIPTEPHDEKMDLILTPSFCIEK